MYRILLLIIIGFIIYKVSNKNKIQYNMNSISPEQQIELDRIRVQKDIKWALWFALGSLLLFILIIVICLGICISVGVSNNPASGWLLVMGIWFIPPFIIPMIALNVVAHMKVNTYKRYNFPTPSKTKKLIIFNYFQIPLIIITIIFGLVLMSNLSDRTDLVKKEIEKRYGNEYTILCKDHISNEGGTNEIEMLVKIEGLDVPLYVNYDIMEESYSDSYNSYLRNKKIDYKKKIKEIFKEDILSYMNIYYNYEGYESATLTLIVEYDNIDNTQKFTSNLQKLLDKYGEIYMDFELNIYLTDKVDVNKEYEYKSLIIADIYSPWGLKDEYSYLYKKYMHFASEYYGDYDPRKLYNAVLELK